MSAITLAGLHKSYRETPVVKGIDLDIAEGEFVVLVGPSGCGKSTLLKMIAGLETVSGGDIRIGGRSVVDLPPAERDLAMVFQSYALYPHMTVAGNIGFSLKVAGLPRAAIEERVRAAAATVKLEGLLDRYPRALSGGQRQRVAIARALARQPKVLLFDEPLSNLDAALRQETRVEIARLHKALKATILYVTHDQVEAMTLADRIVLMNNGRIEQAGTPLDLYERPASLFVARFLGTPAINLFSAARFGIMDAATIGIRPEHVGIEPFAVNSPLPARVEFIEELGDCRLVHLLTEAEEKIVSKRPAGHAIREGERVSLVWREEDLHLFDLQGRRIDARPGRRPERAA